MLSSFLEEYVVSYTITAQLDMIAFLIVVVRGNSVMQMITLCKIILTYKAKPFETTTKKYLLVSSHLPSKHIGQRNFQIEIFISMRRNGKPYGYLYNFIS